MRSATRQAGGSWRGPVELSSGSRNAAVPRLDVGAQGTAVAVWESDRIAYVGPRVILSAVREPGEDWGPPVRLSAAEGAADAPQVAVDPEGNAAAIWLTGEGGDAVRAALMPAGEDWQEARDIAPHASTSEASGAEVTAVMDHDGRVIAVWGREMYLPGGRINVVQAAIHGPS